MTKELLRAELIALKPEYTRAGEIYEFKTADKAVILEIEASTTYPRVDYTFTKPNCDEIDGGCIDDPDVSTITKRADLIMSILAANENIIAINEITGVLELPY